MVFVGEGNHWTNGISHDLWGTEGEVAGHSFLWGIPIRTEAQSRVCLRRHPEDRGVGERCPLNGQVPNGSTAPDWNGAFAASFRYRGLTASALLDATIGFDLPNITRFHMYANGRAGDQDQANRPDGLKKPIQYYGIIRGEGGGLQPEFLEDGSWVKLREVAVGYTFPDSWLDGFLGGALDRVTLTLIGRNLLTITSYSGFDPESGFEETDVGSATIDRWDQGQYPNSRVFSLAVEVGF
jgi:hypothetical protein